MQKALRSLEIGSAGFEPRASASQAELEEKLVRPNSDRIWHVGEAFRRGYSVDRVFELSKIDPWFLENIRQIIEMEGDVAAAGKQGGLGGLASADLRRAKRWGFSDKRLATLLGADEKAVRDRRRRDGILPVYKTVDTCAAEFEAYTPYLYSTYETEDEAKPTNAKKIVILGGGPNRIGQGIEFDYCCVHASFALKEAGYETIMVNCNPETVSTDYDTSDRLYFEPLTLEDVLEIVRTEKPYGVIVQYGGQTPLKLAKQLEAEGVPIIGTPPEAIDAAEDRERFRQVLDRLALKQPPSATAMSVEAAEKIATEIGLPVLVRPSYVLGGRAMEIVHELSHLRRYMERAIASSPEHPILVDKFLDKAIEVDVDAVCDGERVVIGGVMEHIEMAGVHSGDSACSIPPWSLPEKVLSEIRRQTRALAMELGVRGLMNVQYAVVGTDVYVLEVNPRASRTVPFVSKAIGVQLAKIAARVMAGETLAELDFTEEVIPRYTSVKEAVFPFIKFPGVDTVLGPEMKSTGEVMGIAREFGLAFAKAQAAAYNPLPRTGTVFISVREEDRNDLEKIARGFIGAGMSLTATKGTAEHLRGLGFECTTINKVGEGTPHCVDAIRAHEIAAVINTVGTPKALQASFSIRRAALETGIPYFTTAAAAEAASMGVALQGTFAVQVSALQDLHEAYVR
jgi:carbamoyl-phosphate synthase large subunit